MKKLIPVLGEKKALDVGINCLSKGILIFVFKVYLKLQ